MLFFYSAIFSLALWNVRAQAHCLTGQEVWQQQGQSKGEYPLSHFTHPPHSHQKKESLFFEFEYLNPTLNTSQCYVPLSLEEKLQQQAGSHYSKVLGFQLVGYRNSQFYKKYDSYLVESLTKNFLTGFASLSHLNVLFKHPQIIVFLKRAYATRNRARYYESKYFGPPQGDDQGDAFRHYLGASFMIREIGFQNAKWLLDNHEQEDISLGSLMDRYNNMLSLYEGRNIKASMPDDFFITKGYQLLAQKKLVYLKDSLQGRQLPYKGHAQFLKWAELLLEKRIW